MNVLSMLNAEIKVSVGMGCVHCDKSLGFQKMPVGYALMLNQDKSHFFWLRFDGLESNPDWDKWSVRRGAIKNKEVSILK